MRRSWTFPRAPPCGSRLRDRTRTTARGASRPSCSNRSRRCAARPGMGVRFPRQRWPPCANNGARRSTRSWRTGRASGAATAPLTSESCRSSGLARGDARPRTASASAISPGTPTGAQCVLQPRRGGAHWRVSPQLPDHAVIHGTVPDGVIGARVTVGKLTAEVAARNNVIGGVLPLPYEDGVQVELIRRPRPVPPVVGVVDATGISGVAANVLAKIRRSGHPVLDAQPRTDVYWRPQRATRHEAEVVAELLRAELRRIANRGRLPRPVLETDAGIVVVVGRHP